MNTSDAVSIRPFLKSLPESDPGPIGFGANTKPTYTTDQAAKQITRDNQRFHDRHGDKKVDLSYTVDPSFTPQQQRRVHDAVQSWQDVANITFKERASGVDGTVNIKNNRRGEGGVATLPTRSTICSCAGMPLKPASAHKFCG